MREFSNEKWFYNTYNDIYYQTDINYCQNPVDIDYQTLAIFVSGEYFDASNNGDDTYTLKANGNKVNGYDITSAPIVIPVETPGYAAVKALSDFIDDAISYCHAGFVYAIYASRKTLKKINII